MPPRKAAEALRASPGDTREQIIDAAQIVFARDGFEGARMQEIADLVGIQRPSLFYHFRSKTELFVATCEQVFGRFEELFHRNLAARGDPFEQLDRACHAVLRVSTEEPDFRRMVGRIVVDRHPAAIAILQRSLQPLVDRAVEFIRAAQARGVFREDVDPFFFTLTSLGAALAYFMTRDLLEPKAADGEADLGQFTRTLMQIGHRAFSTRPAPSKRPR